MTEPTCRRCGCTQTRACFDDMRGPCSWAEPDLCSHCQDTMTVLEAFERLGADEAHRLALMPHHVDQLLKMLRYTPEPAAAPVVAGAGTAQLRKLVGSWLRFDALENVLIGFSNGIEHERLEAGLGWAKHGGKLTEPLLDLFADPWIAARTEGEWEGSDEDAIREGKATLERADSPEQVDKLIALLGLPLATPQTPAAPGGGSS